MSDCSPLFLESNSDARFVEALDVPEVMGIVISELHLPFVRILTSNPPPLTVMEWGMGVVLPSLQEEQRLRVLAYVVLRLKEHSSFCHPWMWFLTAHPALDGDTPLDVLRHEKQATQAELAVLTALRLETEDPPRVEGK